MASSRRSLHWGRYRVDFVCDQTASLLRAAQNHPVRLNFVRRSGDGPYALAFEFNRWEVVVRADLLLPAATA